MPTQSIYLPHDLDAAVRQRVEAGEFENVSRAVQHAVAETYGGADE